MDLTYFSQSIARVKAMENKMLDKAKFEALIEAKDFDEAVRMLQDTVYSNYNIRNFEEGLKKALEDLYFEMYKIVPNKSVVDVLAARYDGHNIKTLIKSKFSNFEFEKVLFEIGTVPLDVLKISIKEENFRDINPILRSYIERALEDFKSNKNPQNIDLIIDKGILKYMLSIAEDSKLEYLVKLVKLIIDMTNIKAFVRIKVQERDREFFKKAFIEDGNIDLDHFLNSFNDSLDSFANKIMHTEHFKWVKGGLEEYIKKHDLGSLEKYGDNYIMDFIKNSKFISFGPDPLIAYIIARENEIRLLRIVLTGKKNGVAPDVIRERLRDTYV
ncbi:V/A-type H+-transporting ATPase subunit C [Caloramator fervidus]|mgnify:CR=1 FL=1|uniref:NtpC n=1 Tax=Caloramator fervidus TaxID=29344 RepID=Q2EQR8_9CLOT|nr:V-type ATP synthase subunit C [Caloramator fervidus]ABD18897.1 NtpC [Caloramator fervidus DSM 5463]SEF72268.1 V/A-type H+-transporting ATPase subunit C [Caloramator fervidus]